MRIVKTYSHLNGYEWLKAHRSSLIAEIKAVVKEVDAVGNKTKASKEKTKKGKLLYAPKVMNSQFKASFKKRGWAARKDQFWVTDDFDLMRATMLMPTEERKAAIEKAGKVAHRSSTEIDFVKDRVAVEVQFGKYAFIAYDLFVKHWAFYVLDSIDVGVEVLPMKTMQAEMSSGPGCYEKALHDLARRGRGVPSVPLWLIGVDA